MFTKRKIKGNTSHAKNGEFAKSDYKITLRRKRLSKILILEIAVLTTLFIILADLAAQKVFTAIYPINHVEASYTPNLSLEEHICEATNGENCEVLVNLAKCESSLNKEAVNVNTNGTYDAGLFQINSIHKDISLSQKLDVYASARWSNEQIKKGNGHIWVCWKKI
ncbi:transglycosylase SLT domain-containing protein [Candidatus Dojkabacteria bacterium]|jgi:hypothetical protein|nr:transglycosylase SLT domain-containing protein [Candidatus Dojkabacteria bacterium]